MLRKVRLIEDKSVTYDVLDIKVFKTVSGFDTRFLIWEGYWNWVTADVFEPAEAEDDS